MYWKGMVRMDRPRCLLCGRDFPTGLHIMGCFLCFPCEKQLMRTAACQMAKPARQRLLQLYTTRG